jgi:NAD(P)-dependent dehydrogenase (short-subunit alcohol dehydrogenase family)
MIAAGSVALIVGAGPGLSASLARLLSREGYAVALAARNVAKLAPLAAETGASLHPADAADPAAMAALFAALPPPEVAIYNASFRLRGPVATLDPAEVRRALDVSAFGAFLMAREAAARMQAAGRGTMLFTGASAGVKGFAGSAPFAMGKFALRGLAESLARELHPQGIHVAHVVVDGAIRGAGRPDPGDDSTLCPDAVAAEYLRLIRQPRSAWSHEITLRPWVERF